MSKYYLKPYKLFGRGIKAKVDLSNYATKADINNILLVDTSSFALKTNLSNLKTEVDKLDIDKLVPVPVDLSKLSDAVEYIDTQEFYKLTADVFNARLKQANLLKKKQILMLYNQLLTGRFLQIEDKFYLLKMN